ncbi:MAG: ribulose-phosphate 3-epimerase [Minisyncoccia bacterium]
MFFPFIKTFLKKEIVPVINVKTKQKFEERLKILKDFKGTFQIDIADGVFTGFKNWNSAKDLKEIKNIRNRFELHLMIQNVEKQLADWLETKPKRVIVHLEALHNFENILKTLKKNKTEFALALNPDTPISLLSPYLKDINFVVLLGVDAGPSGQKFRYFVLDKIESLRKKYPKINIELDGGINEEIALEALKAGANILAIGSAIFEAENPKEKIKEFEKLLI